MSSPMRVVLTDFTRIEGVTAAAIVSKDGFVIDYVHTGEASIDPDSLAAMVTTLYGAATRLGEELNLGDITDVIIEYRNNYVLFDDVGEALTVLVADRRAILGRLRYELKKQRERIRSAL
ncbi:dynein regulation protein LC7 [Pyrodictium occultum]|uniref:Dynein regulation protein LC7 n=1 Tax=Pyrodictium occultum TaxID=2309 RepID=A0A0V8RRL3_PYROC|nr:roadblock/LC7 domain-containing protein [Pyrodictium occultum]KSW10735.1 dynein regulation protein LC7 [Pyrodictium occultum]